MKLKSFAVLAAASLAFSQPFFAEAAGAPALLWEIGERNNSSSEFALAPKKFNEFKSGALYVVGQSDPKKDWPYVHPGPADTWAGSKGHRFVILFDIEKAGVGTSTLKIDLVDTHAAAPPQLDVRVNGSSFPCTLPVGTGGDAAINGDQRTAKEYELLVPIPGDRLRAGTNEIVIETTSGSWMLYDWIGLETPQGTQAGAVSTALTAQAPVQIAALVKRDSALHSLLRMEVFYAGAGPKEVSVRGAGIAPQNMVIEPGNRIMDVLAPAVERDETVTVELVADGVVAASYEAVVKPVRKWDVYLLPHSHVDIGYTHVQTDIERMQVEHIRNGIKAARETAGMSDGAQFKWNTEVQWPVEKFLAAATESEIEDFVAAARKGWIGIDALYANQLTALSREEELARLVQHASALRDKFGLEVDSAMITDVPGYTWGLVPVLAQSGVKYFCVGPNYGHRIGHTLSEWADRPFYWVSPSGREKVLVWVAGYGYSAFHAGTMRDGDKVFAFLDQLEAMNFPYDIAYLRYSVGGDNGPPDPELSRVVQAWNEAYAYPRLRIGTTGELFRTFEARYGEQIPAVSGDFTPYWEDGAASSALETALTRQASERMIQAEALWAMERGQSACPRKQFDAAWNNIILYNEHTWGAHNSISEPDADFVKQQWAIKQRFALDAADLAETSLRSASRVSEDVAAIEAIRVANTSSWDRGGLVTLPASWARRGDWVVDDAGRTMESQRLANGDLVFMAEEVPAFGARKYFVNPGDADGTGSAQANGNTLTDGRVSVVIDEQSGAIGRIVCNATGREFVDAEDGVNTYWYLHGRDPKDLAPSSGAQITVKEQGPLVASLLVESQAPGCRGLTREIRVVSGLGHVEIFNRVDKEKVRTKESVHFGFALNVPEGVMRLDTPWAVVQPEVDQLPGACKNYFTVQRWVDVSNQDYGVTWATVDAPLLEVGEVRVDGPFVKTIEPSQKFYSYVMNNYWETNYKADQEGETLFRYSLLPHGRFDSAAAAKFGIETSQPLVVAPMEPGDPVAAPLLSVEPAGVIVSGLKISQDGKDFIVRLFGASGKPEAARITWRGDKQPRMWLSDLTEKQGDRMQGTVDVPPWGIITVRVDGQGRVGTKDVDL